MTAASHQAMSDTLSVPITGDAVFTHETYAALLKRALDQYTFCDYTSLDRSGRFVIWRHDVDMSMHAAVALARIEAAMGVQATYFLLPGCEYYNLFEPAIVACMHEIRELGHHFGLHFQCTPDMSATPAAFEAALTAQRQLLETYCERPINVFSYHNPSASALAHDAFTHAGMVNTYARYFRENVTYCSDSNGIWRHRSLADTLAANPERLQVLTHPEWWQTQALSPRERAFRCIDGRARAGLANYNVMLMESERMNICDLGPDFDRLTKFLGEDALRIQMLWLAGEHVLAFLGLWRISASRGITPAACRAVADDTLRGSPVSREQLFAPMQQLTAALVGAA